MAQGYWLTGRAGTEAVFHLFFRSLPFHGGYAVAAGLADVAAWIESLRFGEAECRYLRTLTGNDGAPLFREEFLGHLRDLEFQCSLDAVPEGTVVFPHEPLVRVQGPILQAQLLESALLAAINFQTLIATKAARLCEAAQGDPVIEFGLRRAQGGDGALAASRAAFIGGCAATSNVLAGQVFGIPVRGTLAHSWVMAFDDELTSFRRFAETAPNNCVFLVDTYDSLAGVRHAIQAAVELEARRGRAIGIRLDSGDLAYLAGEARRMLDASGLEHIQIMATNELDEHVIESLKRQDAPISLWGVGTKLVTAFDQPALGGVYKLSALRGDDGGWRDTIKLSEVGAKLTTPGILQVRRFSRSGQCVADMIYDTSAPPGDISPTIVDPADPTRRKRIPSEAAAVDLLVPVFRGGTRVYASPPLVEVRERARAQVASLHPGVRRLLNPHAYPAGLEAGLHARRIDLAAHLRS